MSPLLTAVLLLPSYTSGPAIAPTADDSPVELAAFDSVFGLEPQQVPVTRSRARWRTGEMVMQGFIGAGEYDTFELTTDSGLEVNGSGEDSSRAPVWGGGGGAAVAVDVDSFLLEFYGGPMANMFLGDKTRVYVSAGPLLEWVDYNQGNDFENIDDSGSGFGTGWYARTGIEFALGGGTMMGLGFRWADSTVDLGGGLGDLDLEGYQVALTVTQGF